MCSPSFLFRCFLWLMGSGLLAVSGHSADAPANSKSANVAPLQARISELATEKKIDARLRKLAEVAGQLSANEVAPALQTADTLKELRERAVFRDAVLKRWSQLAPEDAWNYVAKLPEGRGKVELVHQSAAAFAKKDPAAAAAAVEALPAGRSRMEAIAIVAEVWAKSEVPASLKWVKGLPPGPAQDAALYNIRFIWVHSDPVTAADDVLLLPPSDTRKALIMNIAGEWAALDPRKAISWAQGLQDASEQEEALSNIAEAWADSQPREAGEFAMHLPPPLRVRAAVAVISRWATQTPQEAAHWTIQTADTEIQRRGLTEVFNLWTTVDPEGAARWLASLTPGPARDIAVQAFVDAVAEWSPETGAMVALQTSDPELQWQRVMTCLGPWWTLDPASARQWLNRAEIAKEKKDAWLNSHDNR